MRVAMIGLGKMGGNMTARLLERRHEVVAYDRTPDAVSRATALGARGATDLASIVTQLDAPRVIWIMVPAGAPVDETIDALVPRLSKGDVIIDGGNSRFHDTLRRARALAERGIEFVDAGTSASIVSSTGAPAGTMIQITRGASSWVTIDARSVAPRAPSAVARETASGVRS